MMICLLVITGRLGTGGNNSNEEVAVLKITDKDVVVVDKEVVRQIRK